ncbi:MAG: MBL fold metallo-hydrolase [Gemmatimonadetes bacterium]|nr:MBL fold metallo-hydrolase [Gemmatimonadota bacterium]
MKLAVLGSGSRGNAFVVTANGCSLLLDAGFGARTIVQRAKKAGVDLRALVGIVLTHEHGDHARGAAPIARKLGCPIYASAGTLSALGDRLDGTTCKRITPHEPITLGPFTVNGCRTSHDAAEPMAFVVGANGAKLGLAYDLGRPTAAVRYLLRGVTTLLLEANHDEILLRTGPYPPSVRDRIAGMGGHLSNRAAGELLAELCHRHMRSVVLVHVSERCNRRDIARSEVAQVLSARGYRGDLLVAHQDEPLEPIWVAREPGQLELGIAG